MKISFMCEHAVFHKHLCSKTRSRTCASQALLYWISFYVDTLLFHAVDFCIVP